MVRPLQFLVAVTCLAVLGIIGFLAHDRWSAAQFSADADQQRARCVAELSAEHQRTQQAAPLEENKFLETCFTEGVLSDDDLSDLWLRSQSSQN